MASANRASLMEYKNLIIKAYWGGLKIMPLAATPTAEFDKTNAIVASHGAN